MIFVYYQEDCPGGCEGLEEFEDERKAEEWMNLHVGWSFTAIQGHRLKVVPVEVVKQVKLER